MNILDYAIIFFVMMESANVVILYFFPDFKFGNGVSVFIDWQRAKEDESMHLFAKYMANWVANVKLIFIVLLLVILFLGSDMVKVFAVIAMILSIAAYYWRLHPLMIKLDELGSLEPKGYSKTLFAMITGFMTMFSVALIVYLVQNWSVLF